MTGSLAGTATAAAWLLAVVLAWSGAVKLRSFADTAAGFRRIGLPAARPLARIVPWLELVVAATLVAGPRLGGIAAVVLLFAFTVVLTWVLRSGRRVPCGCFGSYDTPISVADLLRNGGLLVLAAVAASASNPTGPALPDLVLVSTAALGVATIVHLLRLRHQLGNLFGTELAGEVGRTVRSPAGGPR